MKIIFALGAWGCLVFGASINTWIADAVFLSLASIDYMLQEKRE